MLKVIFEGGMILCFGLAWPLSIYKSWTSRSTGGKSLFFLLVILLGYIFGLAKCVTADSHWTLYVLYSLNTLMVSCDTLLYFRNRMIEKKAAAEKE